MVEFKWNGFEIRKTETDARNIYLEMEAETGVLVMQIEIWFIQVVFYCVLGRKGRKWLFIPY